MRCVQENAGVSKRVSSFTLPLGSTVNMDGTALYECVAVIFVAQVMGIDLGMGAQFFIVVAALLTSVGVAGIPSASLVAILLILKSSASNRTKLSINPSLRLPLLLRPLEAALTALQLPLSLHHKAPLALIRPHPHVT